MGKIGCHRQLPVISCPPLLTCSGIPGLENLIIMYYLRMSFASGILKLDMFEPCRGFMYYNWVACAALSTQSEILHLLNGETPYFHSAFRCEEWCSTDVILELPSFSYVFYRSSNSTEDTSDYY